MISVFYISGTLVAIIATGVLFLKSRQEWENASTLEVSNLMQETNQVKKSLNAILPTLTEKKSAISISTLPTPVEKHMRKALMFDDTTGRVSRIASLHIEQNGHFFLNNEWIPFTASQRFSALVPGFVWEAKMSMPIFSSPVVKLTINVKDSYVDGKGTMVAKVLAWITMVNMHDDCHLNEGELSRWLAESVLFPTALLPTTTTTTEGSTVQLSWIKHDDDLAATAELTDKRSNSKVEMEFRFGDDNLISSIYGLRPFTDAKSDTAIIKPWEGHFYDYEEHSGIMVPTRMEVGWWEGDSLDLYFKGMNTQFDFEFV